MWRYNKFVTGIDQRPNNRPQGRIRINAVGQGRGDIGDAKSGYVRRGRILNLNIIDGYGVNGVSGRRAQGCGIGLSAIKDQRVVTGVTGKLVAGFGGANHGDRVGGGGAFDIVILTGLQIDGLNPTDLKRVAGNGDGYLCRAGDAKGIRYRVVK